jgi:Putative collagen-binding domain of a collagenase
MELDLSAATGSFVARWFDPRTGKLSDARKDAVRGGAVVRFIAPDQQDWGLWLSLHFLTFR